MFAAISLSSLGAMVKAVLRPPQPRPVVGFVVIATLFFALGNAILVIPLGLVPSWLALASTGFDVALLGVAVAIGMRSTKARRCAPTCCARSRRRPSWPCCSVARR